MGDTRWLGNTRWQRGRHGALRLPLAVLLHALQQVHRVRLPHGKHGGAPPCAPLLDLLCRLLAGFHWPAAGFAVAVVVAEDRPD